MTDINSIERVVEKWRLDGIELLEPCKEADVVDVFSKLGRNVSKDVISLYCTTGGMYDADSFSWSLWTLDRIATENASHDSPYIWFADSIIDAYRYCFKYEDANNSAVFVDWLNKEEPQLVAENVSEFFTYYLDNPEKTFI
jgi:hypothetical protein